jgi:hypothetical protein
MFQQLRVLLPQNLHSSVDDLENICEEKAPTGSAEPAAQSSAWMAAGAHSAVYALLLLGAVHAVMALKF